MISGYEKSRERIALAAIAISYAADVRDAYEEHIQRRYEARQRARNWFSWELFLESGCTMYAPGLSHIDRSMA